MHVPAAKEGERVRVDKITESAEQQEGGNQSHIGRANP